MRRHFDYRPRPSPHRPRGAAFGHAARLSHDEATATESIGAAVGSIRPGGPSSGDDDPLDQILRAAALARSAGPLA